MEKEQFGQMLAEFGLLKDGKPTFISREEFGRTAATINDLKKGLGGVLTADQLVEAGMFERDEEGKLKVKTAAAPPPTGDDKKQTDADKRFAIMQAELEKTQKAVRERDEALEKERKARETVETHRQIQDALTKAGAVNPGRDYRHLVDQVVRRDDGTLIVKTKDKYQVDVELPLEEFVPSWLEQNKELKRATTQQGSGAAPSGAGSLPPNTVSSSKLEDMDWFMKNQDKIMSGEIKIANQ